MSDRFDCRPADGPDAAAPGAQRSLSERAAHPLAPIRGPVPDPAPYGAVIWTDGQWRLAVSPRGGRYVLHSRAADGAWQYERVGPSAGYLLSWLCAEGDAPAALWDAVSALPDNPSDFSASSYRLPDF
jgi:hypothetical protein